MDVVSWLGAVAGLVLIVVGLRVLVGKSTGNPSEFGWLALSLGLGSVFNAIARYRDAAGEDWMEWLGPLCMFSGVAVYWWARRRRKSKA